MSLLTPPCPNCGTAVTFIKTQWGLGKPFACKGCNAKLLIPRNYWIGLGAFVVFWRLKGRAESTAEILLLLVGLVIAVLMLSRLFLIPRKV